MTAGAPQLTAHDLSQEVVMAPISCRGSAIYALQAGVGVPARRFHGGG